MATLADVVKVENRFARSANLERDSAKLEPLDGYIVTARALDVVERIATTAAHGGAGGAWSLTGPYGSGKSSLALLLDAACGAVSEARRVAFGLISDASPTVGELFSQAHERYGTNESGFHRGLVTAQREPLSHTVLRALHAAVLRRYGTIPSVKRFAAAKSLRAALDDAATHDARRRGPSPAALVEVARCLAKDAPLLLIIDEFGKNLEAIGDAGSTDPYLLQQLAELGQGSGLPVFVLTLQHLSFEDYFAATDGPVRREWAKVQGRFEDVAFVESAAQIRSLIGTVFDVVDVVDGNFASRIGHWAAAQALAMRAVGIADLADPKVVLSCYPLHPLAAFVLPELCSRYGQHERTLFSFLTSAHDASAASYLAATSLPAQGALPCLGLEVIYDYFVASGALNINSARQSARWIEIATRLRDAQGLTDPQVRLAKAIALLNLVASGGGVRASKYVLNCIEPNCETTLNELETAGLVTYREFADEYRIWQGTDIDIASLVDANRQRVQRQPLSEVLMSAVPPQPLVAARHSAENHVLRVFAKRYVESGAAVEPLDAFSPYDGEVLLVCGGGGGANPPYIANPRSAAKPIVAAIPSDVTELTNAAQETAAITSALEDPAASNDWVVRLELNERLAQSRSSLGSAIVRTFNAQECVWILLGEATNKNVQLQVGRGSAALSNAANSAYKSTPIVPNEMLNRSEVSTQGSKARRLLLKAMIENGSEPRLGLEGYGPEVAMYKALLEGSGLHGNDKRSNTMVFRAPTEQSMLPAWAALEYQFKHAKSRRLNLNDIYAALQSPPIGMKAAVVPVFVTVGLLSFSDEIAIYEHGTFKPNLDTAISERMVSNPHHFDIKHFANTTGARRHVIDALAQRLEVRPNFRKQRVANVLAIVGHLVSRISRLDNYTRRTKNLSTKTRNVRDALLVAVEPDDLLFVTLPKTLGFAPVDTTAKNYANASSFAQSLGVALEELTMCYEQMLTNLLELLLAGSAETSRHAVSGQATALSGEVLEPSLRAFVMTLANNHANNDLDWIEAIATVVTKKAPKEWTDTDQQRFCHELPQHLGSFQRLVALHADQRAYGGGAFDAFRVTVTRSDGREHARLVGVDHDQREHLESALHRVIDELTSIVGSPQKAHSSLLALLSEHLSAPPTTADIHGVADIHGLADIHGENTNAPARTRAHYG